MFVQRLSSTANEQEAAKAAHLFNILNYVVRTWPWVLVGLAALVVLPHLDDPELAYPIMMVRYLPTGVLGLVFASLLAAFMSTVSTQVNWGASYLVNDLYARFSNQRDEATLHARGALGVGPAGGDRGDGVVLHGQRGRGVPVHHPDRHRTGAGAPAALVLVAGQRLGGNRRDGRGTPACPGDLPPALAEFTFGQRLMLSAFGSMAVWLPVMLLTGPEPAACSTPSTRGYAPPVRGGGRLRAPGWPGAATTSRARVLVAAGAASEGRSGLGG